MDEQIVRFYDQFASDYHLIMADWEQSVRQQGVVLDRLITAASAGRARSVLDCSCGIGTQALGLAAHGYTVHATDQTAGIARPSAGPRGCARRVTLGQGAAPFPLATRTRPCCVYRVLSRKDDAVVRTPQPAAVARPWSPQTFRTFVTGPQNALAYHVALTVARIPGRVYNPLYLSGGPGLGKSHLLQAIGAYLAPRLNGAEVLVLSAETFAQKFAAHLRQGHMLAFRRRYRRAGALLLDDIALLAGRDDAAEELVHTLDALREAGRQIVLAEEQEPEAIRGLSERLRARLEASLVISLGAPDEATRLAILHQKCREWGAMEWGEVTEEALAALAARVRGSVRDLEIALASLAAEAARGSPATAALAARV